MHKSRKVAIIGAGMTACVLTGCSVPTTPSTPSNNDKGKTLYTNVKSNGQRGWNQRHVSPYYPQIGNKSKQA